jgi:hypothetical protein
MDDTVEIQLRPRRQVVDRLLSLIALANRLGLEAQTEYSTEDLEARFDLIAWLVEARAIDELSSFERGVLEARLGYLSESERDRLIFSFESALPLAWSLGLIEQSPSAPTPVEGGDLLPAIPEPGQDVAAFRQQGTSVTEEEAAGERELAEIWYWRLSVERDRRDEAKSGVQDLSDVIFETVDEVIEAGYELVPAADGDFAINGTSVRDLRPDQIDFALLIAEARLHALNWLCGYGVNWDDVPLEID